MPVDLEWTCNPGPQEEFVLGALGEVGEIMYGGAKGGGKSDAIGPKALKHVSENPVHARVLILREDAGEIQELIDRMAPMCMAMGGTWVGKRRRWTFPGGAQIIFGHLLKGYKPYWGHSYSMIIVDEITRCIATEKEYTLLKGSLRKPGVKCQMIILTNPGGKGHGWVKARFKNVPPLTIQRDENGLERVFIPANLSDNRHLDNDGPEGRVYRGLLEQLPDAERKAFLDGDWDAFEGSVFKIIKGIHTWTWAQFKERTGLDRPPFDWNKYRMYDHGFAKPGACLWGNVDTKDRAFVTREYYTVEVDSKGEFVPNEGARIEPRKVAANIKEKSKGESYAGSWTGPDLFYNVRQDQPGGAKIASHFQAEDVHFTAWKAGDGSRLAGKQALHQRMALAEDGWPMIIIIEEECSHLIRTLPALERDKHDPELWDSDMEDHAPDALMGFCKMRPLPTPVDTRTPREKFKDEQDEKRSRVRTDGDWMAN
jgi:hypothetical protein